MRRLKDFETSVGQLNSRILGENLITSDERDFRNFVLQENNESQENFFGSKPNNLVYALPVVQEEKDDNDNNKDNVIINLLMQMQAVQGSDPMIQNSTVIKKQILRQLETEASTLKSDDLKRQLEKINKVAVADNISKNDFNAIVDKVVDTIKKKKLADDTSQGLNIGKTVNNFTNLNRMAIKNTSPISNNIFNVINSTKDVTNQSIYNNRLISKRATFNANNKFLKNIQKSYEKVQNNELSYNTINNVYAKNKTENIEKVYKSPEVSERKLLNERETIINNIKVRDRISKIDGDIHNSFNKVNIFENEKRYNKIIQEEVRKQIVNHSIANNTYNRTEMDNNYFANSYTNAYNYISKNTPVHIANYKLGLEKVKDSVDIATLNRSNITPQLSANITNRDNSYSENVMPSKVNLVNKIENSDSEDVKTKEQRYKKFVRKIEREITENILKENSVLTKAISHYVINDIKNIELQSEFTRNLYKQANHKTSEFINSFISENVESEIRKNINKTVFSKRKINEVLNKTLYNQIEKSVVSNVNKFFATNLIDTTQKNITKRTNEIVNDAVKVDTLVEKVLYSEIENTVREKISKLNINKVNRISKIRETNLTLYKNLLSGEKENIERSIYFEDIVKRLTRETDKVVNTTKLVNESERIFRINTNKIEKNIDYINKFVDRLELAKNEYKNASRKIRLINNDITINGADDIKVIDNISKMPRNVFLQKDLVSEKWIHNRVELVNRSKEDTTSLMEKLVTDISKKSVTNTKNIVNRNYKVLKNVTDKVKMNILDTDFVESVKKIRLTDDLTTEKFNVQNIDFQTHQSREILNRVDLEHVVRNNILDNEVIKNSVVRINNTARANETRNIVKNIEEVHKRLKTTRDIRQFTIDKNIVDVLETERQNKLVFNKNKSHKIEEAEAQIVNKVKHTILSEIKEKGQDVVYIDEDEPDVIFDKQELIHQDGASKTKFSDMDEEPTPNRRVLVHKKPVVQQVQNNDSSNAEHEKAKKIFAEQMADAPERSSDSYRQSENASPRKVASNLPTIEQIREEQAQEKKLQNMVRECVRSMINKDAISKEVVKRIETDMNIARRRMGL